MIREAIQNISTFLKLSDLKSARKELEKEAQAQGYKLNADEKEHLISILYYTICYHANIDTDGGETRLISAIDKKYGSSNPFDEKTTLHLEDISKPYAKKINFKGNEIDDDQWSDIMAVWYPAFGMKW